MSSSIELSGIDTSDATATASDILTGCTAYVNGGKVTGDYVPLDTSDATATANKILRGYTAYAKGSKVTGSYVPPTQPTTITFGWHNTVSYFTDTKGIILTSTNSAIVDNIKFKVSGGDFYVTNQRSSSVVCTYYDYDLARSASITVDPNETFNRRTSPLVAVSYTV